MKRMKWLLLMFLGMVPAWLSAQTVVSTATGGNWSDPNTWIGNVVPVATDDVVIADGATVVIDVNADAQNLTIGEGNSGSLLFPDAAPVTLTVGADLLIEAGANLQSAATGTETGHVINVAGSLHNNGILDLSTNGNTAGAALLFTGGSNAVLDGNGATTDILLLTVDKGTDATTVLEIKPDILTFRGSNTAPGTDAGFLTIVNGTCKLGGTFAMNNGLFAGTTNYTIPATGGFWMANPNIVVAGRDGTAYCDGTLIMDAGVLNVGIATENRLGYIAGSVVTINGGEINVACRFTATTTFGLTYTQTGGVITVNTVENSRQTYASFDIRPIDNSSFTMTGGKIVLQHPNLSLIGPRDYSVVAVNTNITGGTLQVGNAATSGNHTFFIRGTAPDIEINNAAGPAIVQLNGNLQVMNSTIQSGCSLILNNGTNGYQYTQTGANLVNDGTIDGDFPGAELNFSGVLGVAQTYSGSGSFTGVLESLQLDNTQPIDFANTTAQDLVIRQLLATAGDVLLHDNVLVLGTDASTPGVFSFNSGTLIGKFRRWITAATDSWDFPVGISNTTRNANISFTSAPVSAGTLTTEFLPFPGGYNGLPLTEGAILIQNTASDGFWRITAADGLSGGTYTGTFDVNQFLTVIDYSKLVLVKRINDSNPWTLDGTYVPAAGSNAFAVVSRTGMTGFSDFAVGGDIATLPVTVEYFKGVNKGQLNVLDWKLNCTATPYVNITLERSADGRRFTGIHTEYATDIRCQQGFTYNDLEPLDGVNYYRLRVVDADGYGAYSLIVKLNVNRKQTKPTLLYPNPVTTSAELQWNTAQSETVNVHIVNASGQLVGRSVIAAQKGLNVHTLNMASLPAGTYQLRLLPQHGPTETISFIKQ